ncbi:MAG: tetratricopeptide repeat protein [Candidatus Hydrothermarchaeales archaeon]
MKCKECGAHLPYGAYGQIRCEFCDTPNYVPVPGEKEETKKKPVKKEKIQKESSSKRVLVGLGTLVITVFVLLFLYAVFLGITENGPPTTPQAPTTTAPRITTSASIITTTAPVKDEVKEYFDKGVAFRKGEDYSQAIIYLNKVIELDPNHADAYYNRGLAYRELGEHEKAISDYTKAIELDQNNAWVYNNRGYSYHVLKDYSKAISDYSKFIELEPNDAMAYHNRGLAYESLGETDKALSDAEMAASLDPTTYTPPPPITSAPTLINLDPKTNVLALDDLGPGYEISSIDTSDEVDYQIFTVVYSDVSRATVLASGVGIYDSIDGAKKSFDEPGEGIELKGQSFGDEVKYFKDTDEGMVTLTGGFRKNNILVVLVIVKSDQTSITLAELYPYLKIMERRITSDEEIVPPTTPPPTTQAPSMPSVRAAWESNPYSYTSSEVTYEIIIEVYNDGNADTKDLEIWAGLATAEEDTVWDQDWISVSDIKGGNYRRKTVYLTAPLDKATRIEINVYGSNFETIESKSAWFDT